MARLLIVSNRLPVTVKVEHSEVQVSLSSGGLATALRGPHQKMDSLWIGWPGDLSRVKGESLVQVDRRLTELRVAPLTLGMGEIHQYYDGFSNGVLWPLYHYLTDKVEREAWSNWKTYVDVNQKFADRVVREYQAGDIIWIHDYQLSLVPAMVRKHLPRAVIGFFLHIPFPSSEVFRILPWRVEILQGMMGADLIGFHTYSYLRHFSQSALHLLDLETEENVIRCGDRGVALGVFPIGIDVGHFEHLAAHPDVEAEVAKIRSESLGRKLILGVDRLDYTKGLPRRILAIERLLEREPALRDQIRFIQLVVPSREKVSAYNNLRRELDEMVGRINATWGNVSAVPIHCLYRGVSPDRLVALYRAADVMLVTPLRDGMNLVAKEYVTCRSDNRGVLILSEFAGASAELVEAVVVNPYDVDQMARQIGGALNMPPLEQQRRMTNLRARVRGFDAFLWSETFMTSLTAVSTRFRETPGQIVSSANDLDHLVNRVVAAPELQILLDYDGTLVPFASTPEMASPDPALLELLQGLSRRRGTCVHLISGRSSDTLGTWFANLAINLHAEHGFWSKEAGSEEWKPARPLPSWKPTLRGILERFTRETPGSLVEEKAAGLAWHYRLVAPRFGPQQAQRLVRLLRNELSDTDADIIEGEKVVEVRAKGIHKGLLVQRLLHAAAEAPNFLALGDDRTDEDLFQAVGAHGWCVHVGPTSSVAQYRVVDSTQARELLKRIWAHSGDPRPEITKG